MGIKQVKFKRVGIENFGNHIEPVEIEFVDGKIIMITGPNGSGKTTILQSIPFTLYGTCEKGRGEDLLNNKAGKNGYSWVEFEIDNDIYRVDRYIKYSKHGSTVLLSKNGESPYKKGHKEVLPEIEKILVPHKLFMNTMLFSQKTKSFFTDLTDSEQKEIFRKVLKLDDYVDYQKRNKIKLDSIQDELDNISNKIIINEQLIIDTKDQIKDLEEKKIIFNKEKINDIENIKSEINQLKIDLDKINDILIDLDKQNFDKNMIQCQKNITILQSQIDSMEENLKLKKNEIFSKKLAKQSEVESKLEILKSNISSKFRGEYDVVKEEFSSEKIETLKNTSELEKEEIVFKTIISQNKSEILRFEKEKNRFNDLKEGESCPTCMQSLKDLSPMKNHINESLNNINKCNSIIDDCEKKEIIVRDKINILNSDLKTFYVKTSIKLRKIESDKRLLIESDRERFDETIKKLNSMESSQIEEVISENSDKLIYLNSEIKNLLKEKESLEFEIYKKDKVKSDFNEKESEIKVKDQSLKYKENEEFDSSVIDDLLKKITSLNIEYTKYSKDIILMKKKQNISLFWKVGFSSSGIQSMLIDEAIPFMNSQVSDYLDQISGGRYIVSFDTMTENKSGEFKDKININVFDNITHSDKRVKFSGGQERIVDIATILTLGDLQSNVQNVSFNILLFDEIFDSLDDENARQVANLLRKISKNKSIIIIAHKNIDQVEADEFLNFN